MYYIKADSEILPFKTIAKARATVINYMKAGVFVNERVFLDKKCTKPIGFVYDDRTHTLYKNTKYILPPNTSFIWVSYEYEYALKANGDLNGLIKCKWID